MREHAKLKEAAKKVEGGGEAGPLRGRWGGGRPGH